MLTIPQELIEKALALTGKTTDNVEIFTWSSIDFSIEKFCYYLLGPEFIEKYNSEYCDTINCDTAYTASSFWYAIYEYQKWNSQRLIELLSKI